MTLRRLFSSLASVAGVVSVIACSSSSTPPAATTPGDGGAAAANDSGFVTHVPKNHLPTEIACASEADAALQPNCTVDADCAPGGGCLCGAAFDGEGGVAPNQCVEARCLTDSACGANGYCSQSIAPNCDPTNGSVQPVTGFFCHTANDTCDDDTDCTGGAICRWLGSAWACVTCAD